MRRRIGKRFLTAMITIYIIVTLSFTLVHIMPGNPIVYLVGQEEYYSLRDENPEELERLTEKYGLNDSLPIQYIKYLKNIVTLDFGVSYANQRPVVENVARASMWTLLLSVPTWILGGVIGAVLGVMTGWKPGKLLDKILTPFFIVVNTIPSNCLSLIFLIIFSYKLKIFPINGMVSPGVYGADRILSILEHMFLPVLILILFRASGDFMLMKSAVSQVRSEEYIITAEAKGLSEKKVLFRHVLKNAMVPYLTSFCMQFGGLLSGSMIVEVVFGWKGMGTLMYNAVSTRDFPTAQFCFLLSAVLVVFSNFISDFVNVLIDPRICEEGIDE